jgi:hypothetical protein
MLRPRVSRETLRQRVSCEYGLSELLALLYLVEDISRDLGDDVDGALN